MSDCKKTNKYIDLHLHLDGSITPDIAKKLAKLQDISIPDGEELKKMLTVPSDCASLNDFLSRFSFPCSLLQTKEGLREAVYLVAENIKSQGVIYAEIRFAPQLCTNKGLSQTEVVLATLEGLKMTTLKANLILCLMRGEGNRKENFETLEIASKYLVEDGGVVAVDLAGAEGLYPTSDYEEFFRKARDLSIPFTIHAGEADGPESVKCAINYGARRIGHGVRIIEDKEVMDLVKEKGIILEMCPTSNRQTRAVSDMTKYPLIKYLNEGIKVTINTDDMAIEDTTIQNEYKYIVENFSLTPSMERIILTNAIDGAFTSQKTKKKLKEELGF